MLSPHTITIEVTRLQAYGEAGARGAPKPSCVFAADLLEVTKLEFGHECPRVFGGSFMVNGDKAKQRKTKAEDHDGVAVCQCALFDLGLQLAA